MSLFKPATNDQAYLKAGFMGFTGSGKTYTASMVARGLHKMLKANGIKGGNSPVFFADTETGSDWVRDDFAKDGIPLEVARTRAFVDLEPIVSEVSKVNGILLIDSISHFWKELTESYAKRKNRQRLEFQDWSWLKGQWGKYTDAYVNSPCHIVVCGRAGYEYDFFENDNGKKELEKTGVKMKAEGETGYEPSILVYMARHSELQDDKTIKVWRTAEILKDRSRELDGKRFTNPTFETFLPHIKHLNLGGEQIGVDASRNSEGIVCPDGRPDWEAQKTLRVICLEEIDAVLSEKFPGRTDADKAGRADICERIFGTKSKTAIENKPLEVLESAREELWKEIRGCSYSVGSGARSELEEAFN